MYLLKLTGHITAESPIAITLPGGPKRSAKDATPVPTTTIMDEQGGVYESAYIPASSIRGRLRRCAHDALNERFNRMNREALDLRSFYMLRIGGTKSRGSDGTAINVSQEVALRDRNPFLSLFGAADTGDTTFLAGRLEVDHGIPVKALPPEHCPVFSGLRTDDMLRDPAASLKALPDGSYEAWREMFTSIQENSVAKKKLKEADIARRKARNEGNASKVAELDAEIAAINEQLMAGMNSINQPLAGYQAIPKGAVLAQSLSILRPTLAEIGVLFDALEFFSLDPRIGGHRHHGCGRVSMTYTVTVTEMSDVGRMQSRTLGTITVTPNSGIEVVGDALAELMDKAYSAWQDATQEGDFRYVEQASDSEDSDGDDEVPVKKRGRPSKAA